MGAPASAGRIGPFRPSSARPSEQAPFHVEQYQPGPPLPWPAKQPLTAREGAALLVALAVASSIGIAIAFSGASVYGGGSIEFFGFVVASLFFIFFLILLGSTRNPDFGGSCPSCRRGGSLGLLQREEVYQLQLRFGEGQDSPDLATMRSHVAAKLREKEHDMYFGVSSFGQREVDLSVAVAEDRPRERQSVFESLEEVSMSWGPRRIRRWKLVYYRKYYGCKLCGRKWVHRSFPSAD